MHTRNSQGRQVSLLNDDPSPYQQSPYPDTTYASGSGPSLSFSETPDLTRSDSCDSNNSGDALSPTTPVMYDYGRMSNGYPGMGPAVYDEYPQSTSTASPSKRPGLGDGSQSASYDEDSSANSSSATGKRYPCRYRDTHGCDKTFTTSGHASRHSKIHTAEKAVPCTFANCHKKFTRADNMKQHLETHYKDKSRSAGSRPSGSRSSASGSSRRASASSSSKTLGTSAHHQAQQHRSHRHHHTNRDAEIMAWEVAQYSQQSPIEHSAPSPGSGTTWDLRPLNNGLGGVQRAPNGLDTLAMAIACQEGGGS